MNPTDTQHSDDLRSALLHLDPSGPNGFEGLLAIVLAAVTDQPFRLAQSGSQRGRDGDSAFDQGATYFEAKRYETSPAKKEISAKVLDLMADDSGQVDLWILGATCEISAQTATDTAKALATIGIGLMVLDWSTNDLGSLLVAIAAANEKAKSFLTSNLKDPEIAASTCRAIEHFAQHPDLLNRLTSLRKALREGDSTLAQARASNARKLTDIFSSQTIARAMLGQPLAPMDSSIHPALTRSAATHLMPAFGGPPGSEIYCVTGDEGAGKSWLIANSWLSSLPASIMLFMPAPDLHGDATSDFEAFLIQQLIRQTGEIRTDTLAHRWRRRLKGWRLNPDPENVRLTLVIDGLDQAPNPHWYTTLAYLALKLSELGGRLVVSTRTTHWNQIRRGGSLNTIPIRVPTWTPEEVREILKSRNIDADGIAPDLLEQIRNPRMLGLTIDLFTAHEIESFGQLTPYRLMFEYMRKTGETGSSRLTGDEFAQLLRNLAAKAIQRYEQQEFDDLRLFDVTNHNGLQSVASSNFFAPVTGSAVRYEIRKEGLSLALALFLRNSLEHEHRNGRDPSTRLSAVLEPIAALDEAAGVVLLATQISCLDPDTSPKVVSALLENFVSLQNLPNENADAFAILVRSAPESFLTATENIYLNRSHFPNANWLLYALLNHRDIPEVWNAVSAAVRRWLSFYSLAPERMMLRSANDANEDELEAEREKRQSEIDGRLVRLTPIERSYMETQLLPAPQSHFESLQRIAFYLIAGKPLADFAAELVRWCFCDILGPAVRSPGKEFAQLLRFNRVDWHEMRNALLQASAFLNDPDASTVSKWALVKLGRATGHVGDAEKAEALGDLLTKDLERRRAWSLIRDYCLTDPCDPASVKPDNVEGTSQRYARIDPAKLAINRGQGTEDHFFNMARPGVARFCLDDAVVTHRAFADDVLIRNGLGRRQGAIALLQHSAVLTKDQAIQFLEAGQSIAGNFQEDRTDDGKWLVAQYYMFMALPHLSADDQLQAISHMQSTPILLDLLESIAPASTNRVDQVLTDAIASNELHRLEAAIAALAYSRPSLSQHAISLITPFISSEIAMLRCLSLAIAATNADPDLLGAVVASGWDARRLLKDNSTTERWFGSRALLEAAKAKLISLDQALDRMDIELYDSAALALGPAGAQLISARVEIALQNTLGFTPTTPSPQMVQSNRRPDRASPPLISLDERSEDLDDIALWNRIDEGDEEFHSRQQRMARSFERFAADVTREQARLILTRLSLEGMQAFLAASPDIPGKWLKMVNAASDTQLPHVYYPALHIALLQHGHHEAQELLKRLLRLKPTVGIVETVADIPSEAIILWKTVDTPARHDLCKARLRACRNDRDLSMEVLAAFLCGKEQIINEVITSLLDNDLPFDTCMALTIAGFSDDNSFAECTLARFEGVQGYVGLAQKAAQEAYKRNVWARTWFAALAASEDSLTFWRLSVQLEKIVDGRFAVWGKSALSKNARSFYPTIERALRSRIEKWSNKRKGKLFGEDIPELPLFPSTDLGE